MSKFKDVFENKLIIKGLYFSLFILLFFLFIDAPIREIKSKQLLDFNGGAVQALIIMFTAVVIERMIKLRGFKQTAIFFLSILFIANLILAVGLLLPEAEEKVIDESTTQTDTDVEEEIQAPLTCIEISEIDPLFEENPQCKSKAVIESDDIDQPSKYKIFVKYVWLINFIVLGVLAYCLMLYLKRNQNKIYVTQEVEEELIESVEIEIDEIDQESFEEVVYSIYRQLCDIAKQRNGLTRRISMSSSEYGELLVKLGFPKTDIFEIVNAFEALRYGHIQVTDDDVNRLNQALNNINQAMGNINSVNQSGGDNA